MKLIYSQPQKKKPLETKIITMTELSSPTNLKTDKNFDQTIVLNEMLTHTKTKQERFSYCNSVLHVL